MSHMGLGSGAVTVTCGVKAKEERARHGKGQHPDGCNHEGHPPAGALSCAMLVVNWHNHRSVPVKGRGERIDTVRKDRGDKSKEVLEKQVDECGKRKMSLMEKENR